MAVARGRGSAAWRSPASHCCGRCVRSTGCNEMKLRSATLRTFTAVHTWTGLVAGFALFVAFYAGAITVFHHDLPAWQSRAVAEQPVQPLDETQRLLRSEEHTSELQSLMRISYAVFCLKK